MSWPCCKKRVDSKSNTSVLQGKAHFEHCTSYSHLSVEPYYLDFQYIRGTLEVSNCKLVKRFHFYCSMGDHMPDFSSIQQHFIPAKVGNR